MQVIHKNFISEFADWEKEFQFHSTNKILQEDRNLVEKVIINDKVWVLKTYKKISFINRVIYAVCRPSKAKRAYFHAIKLIEKEIFTPLPIAYNDEIYGSIWLSKSWFLSEFQPYDFTFRELIEQPEIFNDWEILIQKTAKFVLFLHSKNVYFKDLSPGNLLYSIECNNLKISLIDTNRMEFKHINYKKAIKNLSTLSLTPNMEPIFAKEFTENHPFPTKKILMDIQRVVNNSERKKKWKKRAKQCLFWKNE